MNDIGIDLAGVSDDLVTSALLVLAMALVLHAVAAALARTSRTSAVPQAEPVAVGVSSSAPTAGGPPTAPGAETNGGTVGESMAVQRLGRAGTALVVLGTIAICLAVVARGIAAGRAPWGNMYEFGLTGSAGVLLAALVYLRGRASGGLASWLVAVALVLLGVSVTTLYTPVDDLVPVLNSRWLVVHVAAAIVAGSFFTVGAVATVASLVTARGRGADERSERYADVAHTVHLVAFPIWTFAVIAGAVWAENAWGRYWGWDPKETWAFITWVLYAAHLHAMSTPGWRRRGALLAVAGFAAFIFNFFGVNLWIPGLHSYAGV